MTGRIIGTGSCMPENVITNDYLAGIMDTSDEWISSRTGIRERRLAKDETTVSMSVEAAKKAMSDAGITADEIDIILVGTVSSDDVIPSTACSVQAAIGAVNAFCFDISAACSGFMYGLTTAQAFIKSGMYKTALVIGAETLSKIMDWSDRTTCVLFGDGAGAAVVRQEETGIGASDQGSDGGKGHFLTLAGRSNNNPIVQTDNSLDYVAMDGQEIYKFAVKYVPASIKKVLEAENLSVDDIKYFILHQANLRIIESVAKRLKSPIEKFPISVDHYGNISAGSIPILLDEINKKGMLKRGDKLILSGFGGGLTWGTAYIEW